MNSIFEATQKILDEINYDISKQQHIFNQDIQEFRLKTNLKTKYKNEFIAIIVYLLFIFLVYVYTKIFTK